MGQERLKYTELAQPGEDYLVSVARIQRWIYTQLTPEQFREVVKGTIGITVPDDFRVELSPEWAIRAVVPLIDHRQGLLVGVRLDHHNLEEGKEGFVWRSEGVSFEAAISEEGDHLLLELVNPYGGFLRRTRTLDFFVTNIYQEAERGNCCQLSLADSRIAAIPLPVLVEDILSVFVWIAPDRETFMKSTYLPGGYELRQAIEQILVQEGF